jgi:S1-C subfamily serine protease
MKAARPSSFLAILFCFTGLITASTLQSQVPSIGELEKVVFTTEKGPIVAGDECAEVSSARSLFRAYDAEAPAIAKYRDPILTRGPRGEAIFKSVSPAVVVVVVGSLDANQNFNPESLGAGAIVDDRGYVLTNWHVVNGYRGAIILFKPSGSPDLANPDLYEHADGARVVYQDPRTDLALLRLIDPPTNLPTLTLGDINQVQVAEDVHVIGHPHGNLWSYSTGVVSQIRDGYKWSYSDGSSHEAKVLQLQTAINPGNSGGPVVDDSGAILGLVATSEEGQNLDYAVAVDVIKSFLFIGMQIQSRGAQTSLPSSTPEQLLSGKLPDGRPVLKFVYSDVVLYNVRASDGAPSGLVANFKDNTVISAWRPDLNGNFRAWSADLPNGHHLIATASNGTLSEVSEANSLTR